MVNHGKSTNSPDIINQRVSVGRYIQAFLEPFVLVSIIVAFWHHSPPIRDQWVWLLLLAIPIFYNRWLLYGRLATPTPLLWLLLPFILLTAYNFESAPFSRADYWVLVCRPLLGIWLVIYAADYARLWGQMDGLLIASACVAIIVGGLALTSSQWVMLKSEPVAAIIESLPRFDHRHTLPDMHLSFNPNEIAGALAWVCVLTFGLLFYPFAKPANHINWAILSPYLVRITALIGFILTLAALYLGQSRSAIVGVIIGIAFAGWLLASSWRLRAGVVAFVVGLILLEGVVFLGWFDASPVDDADTTPDIAQTLFERDSLSLSGRFEMWQASLQMVLDYPLTGVGMSMFRAAVMRQPYYDVIESYHSQAYGPPHAHNEWIQIAADLGLPGLLFFAAWHIAMAYMVWVAWRSGWRPVQVIAIAAAAGLLAHGVYGLADAITLWDRYTFLFWWVVALIAGQYVLVQYHHHVTPAEAESR